MKAEDDDKSISRRKFLGSFVVGVSGVVAAIIATPALGYFLSPTWAKSKSEATAIAHINDIPPDEPTYITYEETVRDGWYVTTLSKGVWVLNKGKNQFVVYDAHCTHLNCPYYWDKKNKVFLCPCHNGKFDIEGNVIGGPPPRPLDRLQVTLDGDIILIGGTQAPKGK